MKYAAKRLFSTFSLGFLFFHFSEDSASAESVRHLFNQDISFLSHLTQGACGALTVRIDSYRCNPAVFLKTTRNSVAAEIISSADEATYRTLWRFATQPFTAEDVQNLFSSYSFTSFSGFARFSVTSPFAAVDVVPKSVVGAYKITNPSIPFLQLGVKTKSSVSSTVALDSKNFFPTSVFAVAAGATLTYERELESNLEIDALTAATAKVSDFMKRTEQNRFNVNFGLHLASSSYWIPSLGIVCRYCLPNPSSSSKDAENKLDIQTVDERASSLHSAWEVTPGLGTLWFSGALFWSQLFQHFQSSQTAISMGYRMGEFIFRRVFHQRVGSGDLWRNLVPINLDLFMPLKSSCLNFKLIVSKNCI